MIISRFIVLFIFLLFSFGCQYKENTSSDWHKNASMYEVNIRQYTPEGTFNAFIPHMNRIKKMGIDILWLMPIHPIGEINRKGSLGSYYSVQDYFGINPEFGTHSDFKRLIDTAHSLDMKVIIDWVANHTAFDNDWLINHPEWYTLDSLGKAQPPAGTDWWDVADLNYDNTDLRLEMIRAMQYWIKEFDVDGFRCDVASWVPNAFWKQAIDSLHSVKSVFMLAESNDASLHRVGFDIVYAWEYRDVTNEISRGVSPYSRLDNLIDNEEAYRLYFSSNHDENSWHGTVFERYGEYHKLYAVMAFTINGMPLLYSGQEAALNKRLKFFEKDIIPWSGFKYEYFYTKLLQLHNQHPALWNGKYGGDFIKIDTDYSDVYSFQRKKENHTVYVFLNFSNSEKSVSINDVISVPVTELFSDENYTSLTEMILPPFGYKVFFTQ